MDRETDTGEDFWSMPGKTWAMFLLDKWGVMWGDWRFNGGAMDSASPSTVSVWHCVFSCFRRPEETTVGLCVCVSVSVLGPSPEPMYYKCSHCKIIFGFSRPGSNYNWHLILFAPFTDPLTPAPVILSLSLSLSLCLSLSLHLSLFPSCLQLLQFFYRFKKTRIGAGDWISNGGSDLALFRLKHKCYGGPLHHAHASLRTGVLVWEHMYIWSFRREFWLYRNNLTKDRHHVLSIC